MNNVSRPPFSVANVLKDLKRSFSEQEKDEFVKEEVVYQTNASARLASIPAHSTLLTLSSDDLISLYEDDFAHYAVPRHKYYEKLIDGSPRCPYCGIAESSQVDHFLPKSEYSSLSIVPDNLIPICDKCNKMKWKTYPLIGNAFFINPYFQLIPKWLEFELDLTNGVSFIIKPINENINYYSEIKYTIAKLKLRERIHKTAIIRFNDMEMSLKNAKAKGITFFHEFLICNYNPTVFNDINNEIYSCILNNETTVFNYL